MTTTTPETAADPSDHDRDATFDRRRVLLTSAVAVAGVAVTAACGSSSGSSSGGGSANGPISVKTADVPVGGGVVLADTKVVVTQPTAGTFKAFSAVCTHQGCVVASVSSGTITCPCHGSTFSAADGTVKGGPAPAALPTLAVTVDGANLTVTR